MVTPKFGAANAILGALLHPFERVAMWDAHAGQFVLFGSFSKKMVMFRCEQRGMREEWNMLNFDKKKIKVRVYSFVICSGEPT